jgi:hypothetical protein
VATLSPATAQAVTADELRIHSRIPASTVPGAPTDTELNGYLLAAQRFFELNTDRVFGSRSVTDERVLDVQKTDPEFVCEYFPDEAVAVYYKSGASWVALDSTKWKLLPSATVRVTDSGDFTESTDGTRNLRMTYSTGTTADDMAKNAIKCLAAHYFENRESTSNIDIKVVPQSAMDAAALLREYWGPR